MVVSDQTHTYHYNAIGSTMAMTDQSQNVVNKYAYSPFGGLANMLETVPQPFKFVGQFGIMTESNGLYYMRARYYDQQTGRFISEDPIGFAGGDVNLYAYVQNNPVNFVDPLGLITPGRISNFGTSDVDFSILVPSHALLDATSKSSSIAASYSFVSGYGLPASIVFGSISIVSKSLDVALYSNNSFVDSAAAIGGQFIPAPYDLLAFPFIDLATDYGKRLFGGSSNNTECP